MAKNSVADWDSTAANNTDVGGIDINEGCPAANLNNAVREVMAQVKTYSGTVPALASANTYTKIQKWAKGADVASASTLTLGDDGNYFDITGTTAITAIATKGVGTHVLLQFDGILTLTHSADLVLPGGANITTAAGDHFEFVEYASGDWRCTGYALASGEPITTPEPIDAELYRGIIQGLTLNQNGTDATNDIDIATGSAGSDGTTPVLMTLASALTKRIDASWAVGTNQGGLDTGSAANTTYYVWLIQRSDTGVVDVLFSTSASSPTMPTSYDRKRLIGSFIRASAANGMPVNYNKPEFQYVGAPPMFGARAWVSFSGTGTVAIRGTGAGNVSSITDNGVGLYTINFATAMPDANYAVVGTASENSTVVHVVSQSTGSCQISTRFATTNTAVDAAFVNVLILR